jgi:acyl-CoA thioester hydrolase
MTSERHSFDLRIYYEDTDHGGVVYYANYLKYMERARTEFMRGFGIELDHLESDAGVLFAVTEAHVHYRRPARFNDALSVHSQLTHARGARLGFRQTVMRGNEILVEGDINLACIDTQGQARRIPQDVLNKIGQALSPGKETRKQT